MAEWLAIPGFLICIGTALVLALYPGRKQLSNHRRQVAGAMILSPGVSKKCSRSTIRVNGEEWSVR